MMIHLILCQYCFWHILNPKQRTILGCRDLYKCIKVNSACVNLIGILGTLSSKSTADVTETVCCR